MNTRASIFKPTDGVADMLKQEKIFKGTWLGRPGTSQCYYKTSHKGGPRVVVHVWSDTGEAVVRAVTGDAFRRPGSFKEFKSLTQVNPTPVQLQAMIDECEKALP